MDKKTLRRERLAIRDALSQADRERFSELIAERLLATDAYRNARVVLSYASFRSEVITTDIHRRILADGKELYLPRTYLERQEMVFYRVRDLGELETGTMGIPEPREDEPWTEPDMADDLLVLVPGVAFDDAGNRMGYGGGFYDRFFREHPGYAGRGIFLAYEAQRAESLPTEPADVRLKQILTEEKFYAIL